jgi:DNA polymerase III delta subunit-like protein
VTPDQVSSALAELPPAALVLGSGSWALVQGIYERQPASVIRMQAGRLDPQTAREVVYSSFILPPSGSYQLFAINLAGAGQQAQNILLKVLEERPGLSRFLLAADRPPLGTIMSRCQVYRLSPRAAEEGAELAGLRRQVSAAVRAARDGHAEVLEAAMRGWEPAHAGQLQAWAAEAASGRWVKFSADFAPGVTSRQALAILHVLSSFPGSRTASRVALDQAFGRLQRLR